MNQTHESDDLLHCDAAHDPRDTIRAMDAEADAREALEAQFDLVGVEHEADAVYLRSNVGVLAFSFQDPQWQLKIPAKGQLLLIGRMQRHASDFPDLIAHASQVPLPYTSVCEFFEERAKAANFPLDRVALQELWKLVTDNAVRIDRSPSSHPGLEVLVPGEQNGERIGNDTFVAAVLTALPRDVLYRRGGVLGELVRSAGRLGFRHVDEHRLRVILDAHIRMVTWRWNRAENNYEKHYVPCTRDLACVFMASAAQADGLRELRAIVCHPVFTSDFELAQPGWNERDGIFYDEPEELVGLQPSNDNPLDLLSDLLTDFPFRNEASRENTCGLMLTALCATAIRGNIPPHLVEASQERTGKGLLIDISLGAIVLGEAGVPPIQIGRTEDEREKRITSAILAGITITHFDNLPAGEALDSQSLASLTTSRVWRGRPLGRSEIVELPNTIVPVFSGNNPQMTGELAKRTVPISLQPKTSEPEERTDFVHPDIRTYARQQRRQVLAALLGMVIEWRNAGSPSPKSTIRMGGFEDWVRVVGGVMQHAGAEHWMTNYSAWVRNTDCFGADAKVLVEHWLKKHGHNAISTADVAVMVVELDVFTELLVGPAAGTRVRLGKKVLKPLANRPVANQIVKRHAHGNGSRYSLEVQS